MKLSDFPNQGLIRNVKDLPYNQWIEADFPLGEIFETFQMWQDELTRRVNNMPGAEVLTMNDPSCPNVKFMIKIKNDHLI